jgi:hypothetical protein
MVMKRLSIVVLILTLMSSFSFAQQKYVGWSLGYYTTWDNSYTPATIPWDAFTAVAYFQVEPKTDGTLNTPSDAVATQLIKEGHARGKKVVYCIGGAGVTTFTAACANGVRGKLISNMIAYMKRLGYDGIDTDWEESFNNTEFVAWHKDLRDSINKLTPVPMLTIAAEDWAPVTLTVSAYVDQVNDMFYSASANQYLTNIFPTMTKAGVPKSKCGAGMGISMNNSVAMDTAICRMVIDNGFGGIIQWAITKNNNGTPNMLAIAKYVNPAVTSVFARSQAQYDSPVSLFVNNSGMPDMNQIRYTLPGDYSGVDLTIYDLRGAVVKTLVHGPSSQGTYSVPFKRVGAGEYVVRLTTSSGVQAARSMLIK